MSIVLDEGFFTKINKEIIDKKIMGGCDNCSKLLYVGDEIYQNIDLKHTHFNLEFCNQACYNNKGIKNIVENKFNNDLYLDSNDLFNRRNSQRQFYTMPNTSIPNKQGDFAKWLYDRGPTCKEGNCTTSSGGWGASPAPSSR